MGKVNLIMLIYFVIIAAYGITEIILQLKFSNWKFRKTDKGLMSILIPFYLSIYMPPAEHFVMKHKLYYVLIIIGFILLITGILLRICSFLTLKRNFSLAIEADRSNKLVVNGIYSHIRHPLYLASLITSLAGSIIFSCILTWIFVFSTLVAIILRIKKEEIFLTTVYPEYEEYKNRTYKLLPFFY